MITLPDQTKNDVTCPITVIRLMKPIYRRGNIFTRDSRERSDIFFFPKTLLLITFHVGNVERGRHNSSRSNGKIRIFVLLIYQVPNVSYIGLFFPMGLRTDSRGSAISPTQTPLLDNTQPSQQTHIHAPGGIRTRNPSKREAADPRLRPRGHRDCHIG